MADKSKTRMNLAAIKKVDPYAKDIVDTSSHVAFYIFNSEQNEWEKTDVEGAFFIYSRNAQPIHSIFIINRINTTSFVEPITSHLELQATAPFLLYRNEKSRIRGFWFYKSRECERISNVVNELVQSAAANNTADTSSDSLLIMNSPSETVTNNINNIDNDTNKILVNHKHSKDLDNSVSNNGDESTNTNRVNIFKMLTHAQQEYKNNQVSDECQNDIDVNKQQASIMCQSLPILAQNQAQGQPLVQTQTQVPLKMHQQKSQSLLQQPTTQEIPSGSVLKFFAAAKPTAESSYTPRILANTLSVEQLEKQQRDTAPVLQIANRLDSGGNVSFTNQSRKHDPLSCSLLETVTRTNTNNSVFPTLMTRSDSVVNSVINVNGAVANVDIDNSMSDCKPIIATKNMPTNLPGQKISLSNIFSNLNLHQCHTVVTSNTNLTTSMQTSMDVNPINTKPALMPPTMFDKPISSGVTEPLSQLIPPIIGKRELLNKYQFVQAFNYLMQNDEDFVQKLHEAYQKTLTKFGAYQ